jgi:hypothetical protein
MPYRVLVIGPQRFRDYPRLRRVLDSALSNRLPDVELGHRAFVSQLRYPGGRDEPVPKVVAEADAAVALLDQCSIEEKFLLAQIQSRGIPVRVVEVGGETEFNRVTKRPG